MECCMYVYTVQDFWQLLGVRNQKLSENYKKKKKSNESELT